MLQERNVPNSEIEDLMQKVKSFMEAEKGRKPEGV